LGHDWAYVLRKVLNAFATRCIARYMLLRGVRPSVPVPICLPVWLSVCRTWYCTETAERRVRRFLRQRL